MAMTDAAPRQLRHTRILNALRQTGFQSVSALAAELDVSDMTIRRDLRKLEEAGELRVVHGGASLRPSTVAEGYEARAVEHAQAKQAIGRVAAGLIATDETIGIDAGTTTHELAAALDDNFAGSVVTCSVPVIHAMAQRERVHLIGTGGDLYRASQAFVGPAAVESIERLRFKTVFIGAGGADERGLYVAADIERPTKRALMRGADRVVVLLDSSKFESFAPVRLCTWEEIDLLITDQEPPGSIRQTLCDAEADVITA
jgi:DeoR/GlpR family transcriptional regulator of sugar metabolism